MSHFKQHIATFLSGFHVRFGGPRVGVERRDGVRLMCRSGLCSLAISVCVLIFGISSALGAVGHDYLSQLTEVPLGSVPASGPLVAPLAVAVDGSNDVWVADGGRGVIDEFNQADSFVTQIAVEETKFKFPMQMSSIAVSPSGGDVYVPEFEHDLVLVFSPTSGYVTSWNGSNTPNHNFGRHPAKLQTAVDLSTGNVYVTSEYGVIDEFTGEGTYLGQVKNVQELGKAGVRLGGNLEGVTTDAEGNSYVIGTAVQEFDGTGSFVGFFNGGTTPEGFFSGGLTEEGHVSTTPGGLAVNSNGDIYAPVLNPNTKTGAVDIFGPGVVQHTLTVTRETPGFVESAEEEHIEVFDEQFKRSFGFYGKVTSFPGGVDAGGVAECNKTCSSQFDPNTSVTLTAKVLRAGARFLGWAGPGAGTCGPELTCVVKVGEADVAVTAKFEVPTDEVSVSKTGTGTGTVEGDGIECGATCSLTFQEGREVGLRVTPDPGSAFVGWSGGSCSGTGACIVNPLTSDLHVTAEFKKLVLDALTVSKQGTGQGTVSSVPSGIECSGTCSHEFFEGEKVVLTAKPDPGSTFVGWSGGGCSGTGTCSVTLAEATLVKAEFKLEKTLTVTTAGTGGGTISSVPVGIECGATCSHAYLEGTHVLLSATADGSSIFVGWSGGGCSGTGTCEVGMLAATQVTAEFESAERLTVSKSGNGGGRVVSEPSGVDCGASCSGLFREGTSVRLSAIANATSTFTGWSGGGCSGTGVCEVSMSSMLEVSAGFEAVPVSGCPNEQLRLGQPSGLLLPDCRAFEMVSPQDKNSNDAVVAGQEAVRAAVSGDAVTYNSFGSFAGGKGAEFQSQYVSRREGNGWSTANITPPFVAVQSFILDPYRWPFYTPELSSGLTITDAQLTGKATPGYVSLYEANIAEGSYRLLTDESAGVQLGGEPYGFADAPVPEGASSDLSHVVFASGNALYDWVDGAVSKVNIGPDGLNLNVVTEVTFGSSVGLWRSVSNDGLRVVMTGASTPELYVREDPEQPPSPLDASHQCLVAGDACTVEVSASQKTNGTGPGGSDVHGPQAAVYDGASVDGSRVFFTSKAELTDDALTGPADNAPNLYEYDVEEHRLVDLTVDGNDANGAGVLGVTGISEDGSYVYFTAEGVLANGAVAGEPNLYVYHEGTIALIATLSRRDTGDWSSLVALNSVRLAPDGSRMAFLSTKGLTGYNNAQSEVGECELDQEHGRCSEVYEYDARTGVLACASCDRFGARPIGPAGFGDESGGTEASRAAYTPRNFSADGDRLFFESRDALVPQDSNGLEDVYEYEDGQVYPLSNVAGGHASYFLDADADGNNVFVFTGDQLVSQDTDFRVDVYDVRVDGGYPGSVSPPACTNGDSCKGPVSPQPGVFGAPASATFVGAGNPAPSVTGVKAKTKPKPKPKRAKKKHKRKGKGSKSRASARRHGVKADGSRKSGGSRGSLRKGAGR